MAKSNFEIGPIFGGSTGWHLLHIRSRLWWHNHH